MMRRCESFKGFATSDYRSMWIFWDSNLSTRPVVPLLQEVDSVWKREKDESIERDVARSKALFS